MVEDENHNGSSNEQSIVAESGDRSTGIECSREDSGCREIPLRIDDNFAHTEIDRYVLAS